MTLVLVLVFGVGGYLDFRGSLKLLSSPHLRGGDKGLLRGILSGGVWNGISSWLCQREKSFRVVFVEVLIMMDTCFGSVLISPLFIFVRTLNFIIS